MKTFRYKFSALYKAVLIFLIVVFLSFLVVNILRWVGVIKFGNNLGMQITEFALSTIFLVILIGVLTMKYKTDGEHLLLSFFSFDLNRKNINIKKMAKVVVVAKNELYVCYTNSINKPQISLIIIDPKYFDNFNSMLTSINPYLEVSYADQKELKEE